MSNISLDFQNLAAVNVHRFKEGTRVLEEFARFVIRDEALFQSLKALKQRVLMPGESILCLPEKDLGGPQFEEGMPRQSGYELIMANFGRMMEAARLLEEVVDRATFKAIRFECYALKSRLLDAYAVFRHQHRCVGQMPVYNLTLSDISNTVKAVQQAEPLCIQVCLLDTSDAEKLKALDSLKAQLSDATLIIVENRLDLALVSADGVHLTQGGLPLQAARKLCRDSFIIGIECIDFEHAMASQCGGASYVCLASEPDDWSALHIPICVAKSRKLYAWLERPEQPSDTQQSH